VSAGLGEKLAAQIAQGGPLTVAQYMTACLHDPQFGYYATRPAIGEDGDFVTAPMISQMFGELVGVWAAACWELLGRPAPFRLVELGAGDGTLMSDVLRAVRHAEGFLDAADVWIVETSAPLVARQQRRLAGAARWAGSLAEVPARRWPSSPTSCWTACRRASSCAPRSVGTNRS
jgi:NADH dehydrogenase [ubiquinone] 1 alpha subcomplex assembly factor 7